jgi:CRP-like cAMP-binding protein
MAEISLSQSGPVVQKKNRKPDPEAEIIKYISNFTTLSPAETQGILESIKVRFYKKGTILLKEGQVASLCYFILKGCIRQYYLIDGEEKTTNFYTEGQPVAPYEGSYKRNASKFYLTCLEDTILTVGTPEDEAKLFKLFPRFEAISRMALEEEFGKGQELMASYIISSPEERYLNLMQTRPELIDRVPQYHLASYLGIKPESLSRIRRRIMGK